MALINRKDRYHLLYILANDISEDKYYGLSHVIEHTLLIPSDIGLEFVARGYTCSNHVYLYFCSDKLDALMEVNRKIECGEIFTTENMNIAKQQVIQEIQRLKKETGQNNRLISFVTGNRIQRCAIGDMSEVSQIQIDDIRSWFEERKCKNQISRFIFSDAHKMIFSTPIHNYGMTTKTEQQECMRNDIFLYTDLQNKAKLVKLYFKIPILNSKEALIKKALFEFCIQRKLHDSIGFEVDIEDRFYDIDERFVEFIYQLDEPTTVEESISMIRCAILEISTNEFQIYRTEFRQFATLMMTKEGSNFEVFNAVKNYIMYSLPIIQLDDLDIIEQIDYTSFPKEWITNMPLKIVVS